MSKEYKIGDTLEYEGIRLKVVEDLDRDCYGCYFYNIGLCNSIIMKVSEEVGSCDAWDRSDGKYIVYVKEE